MTFTAASSSTARRALSIVESLQSRFASGLGEIASRHGDTDELSHFQWLRDEGRHGGGHRYASTGSHVFNRAAINVSNVHYEDDPGRRLASATAISTIIHPKHPHAPSVHIHISWTEMKDGSGYWRLMADLNPSLANDSDRAKFEKMLASAAGAHLETGKRQGDAYFAIPALGRTRGVSHFYLENYSSGDFEVDSRFAQSFGEAAIDCYLEIFDSALARVPAPTDQEEEQQQLAYHTAYFLQVLTLDRGTTSGLLVHDQNDVGILGSLPARVDRELLASWIAKHPPPQEALLRAIIAVLPSKIPSTVDEDVRQRLADVLRRHYREHPAALDFQASGGILPPTVENHASSD